jgi:hypothetical protein
MHNDCRSDVYTDQLTRSVEIDALALGNASSSKSSEYEDPDKNTCPSRDQNEPLTFTQGTAKSAPQPFYGSERTSAQALDQHKYSLYHIQAELRKKREELATAEAAVSNLRNEIKLLEASTRRQSHFEDTINHKASHKRGNDEILHGAKRLKERAAPVHLASGTTQGPNLNRGESLCLNGLYFTTTRDLSPPIISTARDRDRHSFHQNNISSSRAPELLLAGVIQKPEQSLQSTSNDTRPVVPLRVEDSSSVQSLSKQALVDESRERLSDPGCGFLERGLVNCRACSIDDLGQSVAWVASI